MRPVFLLPLAMLLVQPSHAEEQAPPSLVDYPAFEKLTGEVFAYRGKRLISLENFRQRAAKSETLILDTRSAAAFARGHIRGAVNLPFSDFTTDALRETIGDDTGREILIYCNNNFVDNVAPVVTKKAPLALNIPTFINLYGYGYGNIYELNGAYSMKDPDIAWVSG